MAAPSQAEESKAPVGDRSNGLSSPLKRQKTTSENKGNEAHAEIRAALVEEEETSILEESQDGHIEIQASQFEVEEGFVDTDSQGGIPVAEYFGLNWDSDPEEQPPASPDASTEKDVEKDLAKTELSVMNGDGKGFDNPDDQANQFWSNAGECTDPAAFVHKATESTLEPEKEKIGPFPEFEFCMLSTTRNSEVYQLTCDWMKKSIFSYGRQHFKETSNQMWDDVCDVGLEYGALHTVFGHGGIVTENLDAAERENFSRAIDNLPHLRHRWAHPADAARGDTSLQFVCKHISYAKTMAKLLKDQPVVDKITALLNDLQVEGRETLDFIRTHKTLKGFANGETWPRPCQRLFHYVVYVVRLQHFAKPGPGERDDPQEHYTWKRVPVFIREAAADWSTVYDSPDKRKPAWAR